MTMLRRATKRNVAQGKARAVNRAAQVKAMAERGFITVDEASRRSKVPRGTVYRWVQEETVAFERVGPGRVYISLDSLRKLVGAIMDA